MTLQRENIYSPNTQNIRPSVEVRARDKRIIQPGASIHLEMVGGGGICERRKQTDRCWQGPEGWTGSQAEVARGSVSLPKKIVYFMGIEYVISSYLFWSKNSHKVNKTWLRFLAG